MYSFHLLQRSVEKIVRKIHQGEKDVPPRERIVVHIRADYDGRAEMIFRTGLYVSETNGTMNSYEYAKERRSTQSCSGIAG